MAVPKQTFMAAVVLVSLYVVYSKPFATALATIGLSCILYAVSGSYELVLAFLLVSLLIKDINRLISPKREPVGIEAFQVKDPSSVHTRIETVKQEAPLSPHVQNVTGVLESITVLDKEALLPMEMLAKEGVPGASIPASAKARALIYPPSELSVGRPNGSPNSNPVANPYLQNGQDREGVETSLFERGTDGMDSDATLSQFASVNGAAKPF